jgi:hypothetical protein
VAEQCADIITHSKYKPPSSSSIAKTICKKFSSWLHVHFAFNYKKKSALKNLLRRLLLLFNPGTLYPNP